MKMEIDQSKLSDRELLLVLHTNQEQMRSDIKEIKDGTKEQLSSLTNRVDILEKTKVDRVEAERQGRQVARLYNYLWFSFGALAVLQIVIAAYSKLAR